MTDSLRTTLSARSRPAALLVAALLVADLLVASVVAPGAARAVGASAVSAVSASAVQARPGTVTTTVLRGERFERRSSTWRVRRAVGRPGWLKVRRGGLVGTPHRLGRWRVVLHERGVGKRRGKHRRRVLVVEAVPPRAARGTVLVTRGLNGRPANADATDVTVSGDGSTVVFSSRATNLVRGTRESAGRLYTWDTRSRTVSLLPTAPWSQVLGVSADGQRVLVDSGPGIHLVDRASGTVTEVAARAPRASLTEDGERVLYQDSVASFGSPPAHLVEWTRASGATRDLVADVGTAAELAGTSGNGRFALLADLSSSWLLDLATGTRRDLGRLGIEGGSVRWVDLTDDGRLLALRGSGLASGSGVGGDSVAVLLDTRLGTPRGPAQDNLGATVTPDGRFYGVADDGRHLRVIDGETNERLVPFKKTPSGRETWASVSDDASTLAYVSTGHDLLRGTRRGVANVFVWARAR